MVAVDFSEYSLAAASYAASLAQDLGAALFFSHIFNRRDVDMLNMVAARVPEFSVKEYVKDQVNERKEKLQELAKKLNGDKLAVETYVRTGVPFEALLQEIKEKLPDLLVMGAKGRSNVVDIILGSCAQKMFRYSPIPLLSIRDE